MAAMQTTIIRASMTPVLDGCRAVLMLEQLDRETNKRPHGSLPFGSLAIHGNGGPMALRPRLTTGLPLSRKRWAKVLKHTVREFAIQM